MWKQGVKQMKLQQPHIHPISNYGENLLVEHISSHSFSGCDKTKSTSCWNSQTMHSFTAKELPDATSEHCKSICKPAIRSLPSTFKLQFPPFGLRINYLSKRYCPTIAQLSSPHPKLVSSIALSVWQAVQLKIQGYIKSYKGADCDSCDKNYKVKTLTIPPKSMPQKTKEGNLAFQI